MEGLLDKFFLLFPLLFIVGWILLCKLLAHLAGWTELASLYPETMPFAGDKWQMQSMRMDWVNYNNCITFGANWSGIYLSMLFLLRPGHSNLVIPWSAITGREQSGVFSNVVALTIRGPKDRTITISRKLADRLEANAAGVWTYERIDAA